MSFSQSLSVAACLAFFALPLAAETAVSNTGTDTFVAGASVTQTLDAPGDAFVAGRSAVARGSVEGDLHISGFDVSVSAETAQDLYAVGATVVVRGSTLQDLTAAGFTVRTEKSSDTQGNARLFGNSVTVEGTVNGALTSTARALVLNGVVEGDMRVLANTITFGPDAKVNGTLTYSTPKKLDVPDRVASGDRVVFEQATPSRAWKELSELNKVRDIPVFPTVASLFMGFVISLLFFLVLGALALGFVPDRLERLRRTAIERAGYALVFGVIGLSIMFGMVPVTAMTIIGLPFVPIVFLAIIVTWTIGYALGAYAVGMRLYSGLGGAESVTNTTRLLVLAGSLTVIALLNFIPFVGWVANYTLVLLGIGAMAESAFHRLTRLTPAT